MSSLSDELLVSSEFLNSVSLGLLLVLEGGSLSLKSSGGDESLDLGDSESLLVGVLSFLGGSFSSDDVLGDIVFLAQVEELSDSGGSLGAKSSRNVLVSESFDFLVSLLDANKVEGRDISSNDATSNGLSSSLSVSSGSEAGGSFGQQESNSSVGKDSLLHGETLLVVSSHDLEDVSLELISHLVSIDLLSDSLLIEDSENLLVVDFEAFLRTSGGISDVQLHDWRGRC